MVEWNDTKTDYPNDKCIHELFETQVEKTPDAVAVVFEDQRLTYRELNHRANQLAHYLRKLGVGPEVLVGICVERSIELIVGLLGILKAGGAYVPLDPSYPEDRREFILHDSHVAVLLTKSEVGEQSASRRDDGDPRSVILDASIKRVRLDRDRQVVEQESRENLTTHVQPSDAYPVILPTSSTLRDLREHPRESRLNIARLGRSCLGYSPPLLRTSFPAFWPRPRFVLIYRCLRSLPL